MRKLIACFLIVCIVTSMSLGSWFFDSTDVVEVTDAAVLNFPNGSWSLAGWFKMTSNTGSSYRKVYEHTNWGASGAHYGLWFYETSEGTYGDDIRLVMDDDDADSAVGETTGIDVLNDTAWHHFVHLRSVDTHSLYIDGVAVGTSPTVISSIDAISPAGNAVFGADIDGGNEFLGNLAEWAFWTRALTENEIDKLSGTNSETATSPSGISQTNIQWHWDMFDALDTTSQVGSLTASHTGTTVDSGTHPISYGGGPTSQIIHYYRSQQ